jgi:UDP-GlcNAc:undecaprenyl-phosphate/decaprenyl-phosphate GlcNAc-1-phosphate transferase
MEYLLALTGFTIALGATVVATPAVRNVALRRSWVDAPDGHRKLHPNPVPAVGGLAIALGIAIAAAFCFALQNLLPIESNLSSKLLWVGAAAMVLTGFYDDVRGLDFKAKFAVQLVAAYLLLHAGYRIDVSVFPIVEEWSAYEQALLSMPLTMLWIVGVINAVNLLDGLDGLAAGVVLIAFASLGVIFGLQGNMALFILAVVICGALCGFLLYNFNPASIFMGDSGSLFLGYMLAAFSLQGRGHTEPWIALLIPAVVLGLPILDTTLSILRRMRARRAIFAPDRDHIHHRMAARLPHRQAVLALYVVALGFGASATLMSMLPGPQAFGVMALTGLVACGGLIGLGYHHRPGGAESSETEPLLELPVLSSGEPSTQPATATWHSGIAGDGASRSVTPPALAVSFSEGEPPDAHPGREGFSAPGPSSPIAWE